MQIADVMTRDVELTRPDATIVEAAKAMAKEDIGLLPVGENDRLVGVITDRDIAVRAVAAGMDPNTTTVDKVMSEKLLYCYQDEDVKKANENMAELQVRRLPVVDRNKRLVGIVSLADLAIRSSASRAGKTLEAVVAA
jgi:CBS domain-containing protein